MSANVRRPAADSGPPWRKSPVFIGDSGLKRQPGTFRQHVVRGVCSWWVGAAGCLGWAVRPAAASMRGRRRSSSRRSAVKHSTGGFWSTARSRTGRRVFDFIARGHRHRAGRAINASSSARVTPSFAGTATDVRSRAPRWARTPTTPSPRQRLPAPRSPSSMAEAPQIGSELIRGPLRGAESSVGTKAPGRPVCRQRNRPPRAGGKGKAIVRTAAAARSRLGDCERQGQRPNDGQQRHARRAPSRGSTSRFHRVNRLQNANGFHREQARDRVARVELVLALGARFRLTTWCRLVAQSARSRSATKRRLRLFSAVNTAAG
jgi:hypothetical protein